MTAVEFILKYQIEMKYFVKFWIKICWSKGAKLEYEF
jgi:hypothetical protein